MVRAVFKKIKRQNDSLWKGQMIGTYMDQRQATADDDQGQCKVAF